MDKMAEAYKDLFSQIIPESPLKEAFRIWNESEKIREKNRKKKEK
tara:strand:- start:350 stop:484 length:135 start_codon:yes stop_codon:yes gene_type:complete